MGRAGLAFLLWLPWSASAGDIHTSRASQKVASRDEIALADAMPVTSAEVREASQRLSHYPAGQMPVDPSVIGAIGVLGDSGARGEISLLRNVAESERAEVRAAALGAISHIRERQRSDQREKFAHKLPDFPDLQPDIRALRDEGVGKEEAACVAYAKQVLGDEPAPLLVGPAEGDAEALLAEGKPRKALSALQGDDSPEGRMLSARAREDLGDVQGAVRTYASLAASGHEPARNSLDGYGVDTERLLLGVLSAPDRLGLQGTEAEVLEVLVRRGEDLTVAVLVERTRVGEASTRVTATDALGRMLVPSQRIVPLPRSGEHAARTALAIATKSSLMPVREIASEALSTQSNNR